MRFSRSAILCGLAAFFLCAIAFSQVPELINYQAVARDANSGQELSNQQVFAVIRIRDGGPSGSIVYEESHSGIQTNEFGLLNLMIGGGDVTEGSFSSIPWASGNLWFELELDSGEGLQSLGSMQFLSVPYALYAESSGNTDDDDPDPQNELINDASYNPETNTISINQADGSTVEIDLAELLVDDGDPDPTNELIDSDSGLQLNGTTLQITEAGITYSVNLDALVEDDDADPENELIDDNGLTLIDDTILAISEAGVVHEVNLSNLQDDDDWEYDSETVFNTDKRVGVGTSDPEALMEVLQENDDEATLKVGSGDEVLLYGKGDRLGVHTDQPQSSTQFGKSIGYEYNLVTNLANSGYTATEEDHLIVVRLIPGGEEEFTVTLPPADECDGRVYIIRKTGSAPGFGEVLIDTGEFPVDFLSPDVELDEPSAETAVMLSLGANGWSRILREN